MAPIKQNNSTPSFQKEKVISIVSFILGLIGTIAGVYSLISFFSYAAIALLGIASLNIGYSVCSFFQIYEREKEAEIQRLREEYFNKSSDDINTLIQKITPVSDIYREGSSEFLNFPNEEVPPLTIHPIKVNNISGI